MLWVYVPPASQRYYSEYLHLTGFNESIITSIYFKSLHFLDQATTDFTASSRCSAPATGSPCEPSQERGCLQPCEPALLPLPRPHLQTRSYKASDVTVLLSLWDGLAGARALPQKAEQEREGFFFSLFKRCCWR